MVNAQCWIGGSMDDAVNSNGRGRRGKSYHLDEY